MLEPDGDAMMADTSSGHKDQEQDAEQQVQERDDPKLRTEGEQVLCEAFGWIAQA